MLKRNDLESFGATLSFRVRRGGLASKLGRGGAEIERHARGDGARKIGPTGPHFPCPVEHVCHVTICPLRLSKQSRLGSGSFYSFATHAITGPFGFDEGSGGLGVQGAKPPLLCYYSFIPAFTVLSTNYPLMIPGRSPAVALRWESCR